MKQKQPDQSPEVSRKYFEEQGYVVTPEKILSFIRDAVDPNKMPSVESIRATGALIFEMIQAAKYGHSWEKYKKRLGVKKIPDKRFDPSLVTVDDPVFGLILANVKGVYSHSETVALFAEHVCPASDRQIERWIRSIRPRVEKTLAVWSEMEKFSADKK